MANLQSFDASGLCTGIDGPAQVGRFYNYDLTASAGRLALSYSGRYAIQVGAWIGSPNYFVCKTTRFSAAYPFYIYKFDAFGVVTRIDLDITGHVTANRIVVSFIAYTNKLLICGDGATLNATVYDCDTGTFTDFTPLATGITVGGPLEVRAVGFSETEFMLIAGDTSHVASGTKIAGVWTAEAIGGAWTSRLSVNSSIANQSIAALGLVACATKYVAILQSFGLAQLAYGSATRTGAYASIALGTKLFLLDDYFIESPYDLTNSRIIVLDTADSKYKLTADFSAFFDTGITWSNGNYLARYGNTCYADSESRHMVENQFGVSGTGLYYHYDGSNQVSRYSQGAVGAGGYSHYFSSMVGPEQGISTYTDASDNVQLTQRVRRM